MYENNESIIVYLKHVGFHLSQHAEVRVLRTADLDDSRLYKQYKMDGSLVWQDVKGPLGCIDYC